MERRNGRESTDRLTCSQITQSTSKKSLKFMAPIFKISPLINVWDNFALNVLFISRCALCT